MLLVKALCDANTACARRRSMRAKGSITSRYIGQGTHGEQDNNGGIGLCAEHSGEGHHKRGHGGERLPHGGGYDAGNRLRVVHHPLHGIADGLVVQLGHRQGLHALEEAGAHEVNDGLIYSSVEQVHHIPIHGTEDHSHDRDQAYPEHDSRRGRAFEHLDHREQEARIAGEVLDGLPEDHMVDDDLPDPWSQYLSIDSGQSNGSRS